MAEKIFLAVSVAIWLGYGLYCFFAPGVLGESAGLHAATPTATTELRAMYGGLQAAIGVLCGVALVRPAYVRPALTALVFLVTGLASTRLLGLAMDASASSYTLGAIGFEFATALAAGWLLRAHGPAAAETGV